MAQYKVIRNFPNSWGIKKGTILEPYGMESYNCVIVSEDKYNNMMTNIREPYKYPEIFEKVPKKTPNPSKKKGFLTQQEKDIIIEALKVHADLYSGHASKTEWCRKRYNLVAKLKANGETPEVDNPVPSIPISYLKKWSNELINHIVDKYELEYGRETDKERL